MNNEKRKTYRFLTFIMLGLLAVSCSSENEAVTPEPMAHPVKVVVNIPTDKMPAYKTRADGQSFMLRAVAEVYKKGGTQPLSHQTMSLIPTSVLNVYYFEIEGLAEGDYDVYTWLDYSEDGTDFFYSTEDLTNIRFTNKPSDSSLRRAYYGKIDLSVTNSEQTHHQPMKAKSPFAHYRIEAIDIAEYERMKHVNGWPELEDVEIRITYQGYVPTSFNMLTGQPSDAEQGKSFTSSTLRQENGKVIVADDYVFVTGLESSVTINIDIVNPATEEVIASGQNVGIDYRQGYMTTVSGNFLTADSGLDGKIGITTRWDGEYYVEF